MPHCCSTYTLAKHATSAGLGRQHSRSRRPAGRWFYETGIQTLPRTAIGSWDTTKGCVVYYECLPSEAVSISKQGFSRRVGTGNPLMKLYGITVAGVYVSDRLKQPTTAQNTPASGGPNGKPGYSGSEQQTPPCRSKVVFRCVAILRKLVVVRRGS